MERIQRFLPARSVDAEAVIYLVLVENRDCMSVYVFIRVLSLKIVQN